MKATDVLRILAQGRAGTTMCPSDVARALDPDGWRALMPAVRRAAFELVDAGEADVLQRGRVVDGRAARGAIRIRKRPRET
ncbi:MAG TPA: DUF3253 domain-containing protein [Luteitalea sp.]|nr:DUF3253 domain-containing protein [Luteitalea sp.]